MPTMTTDTLATIAARNGVSPEAAQAMLNALQIGGGTMAQFNIPELGGSGQWMRGGMTMVGDMFNNALKARVDGLCNDLTPLLAANPAFATPAQNPAMATQSQWQYAQPQPMTPIQPVTQMQAQTSTNNYPITQMQPMEPMSTMNPMEPMQPMNMQAMQPMAMQPMQPMTMQPMAPMTFAPMSTAAWWPSNLGSPSATGAQNGMQYAVFPASRRLAININGSTNLYDTGAHLISGVQQQQGTGLSSVAFTSQLGTFGLSALQRA